MPSHLGFGTANAPPEAAGSRIPTPQPDGGLHASKAIAVAIAGAFLVALAAGASAIKIKKTELPEAVREAVDLEAPGARVVACWRIAGDHEAMYEVDLPGCSRFSADVTPGPETVDNNLYQYLVNAQNSSFNSATTIGAVRVVYQLQVSPAPAVATFNDVPTSDPAFQFVEALVASGIHSGLRRRQLLPGCCPDAPSDGGVPGEGSGAPLAGSACAVEKPLSFD